MLLELGMITQKIFDTDEIVRLHDVLNAREHGLEAASPEPLAHATEWTTTLLQRVEAQHQANFALWHEEDRARDPAATDAEIAEVKRSIDGLNQRRNDLVEALDTLLLEAAESEAGGPLRGVLHSETPGLMVDRLSILSLKIFHTAEQTERSTAEHRERNRARLAVLEEQRRDLAACLEALWAEVLAGRRRFKLYRQMKMYNDPTLNPVLYAAEAVDGDGRSGGKVGG